MLQSAKTALRVFETIARKEPIGVTDIARLLTISKSTAQRCLSVLHETGWIQPDEHQTMTKWIITSKAFTLGQRVTQRGSLKDITMPFMEKLWGVYKESIHLAVAEGNKVIMLEQLENPDPMKMNMPRGAWAPMHLVASGKLFLAYSDEQFVAQYIEAGLESLTERTLSTPEALRTELTKVRKQRFAISMDELIVGVGAAAAPIFGWDGRIVAALATTMPTVKLKRIISENLLVLLIDAAEEISLRLKSS